MQTLNSVIVEDEFKLLEVLKIKLRKKCPHVQLVGEANGVNDAYNLIIKHKPDLVFLDIALIGETSFELLDKFDQVNFEIIFITSYSEYAVQAFKVSAVDYVLKPIENEELINAVSKATKRIEEKRNNEHYHILKHNLKSLGSPNSKITIPGTDTYKFVKIADLIRFEGWEKYTRIYTQDGKIFTSSYHLGHFRDLVKGFDFFQTHKSHIINMAHAEEYLPEGNVVMSDKSIVPVSRRKKDSFLKKFIR